MGRQIHPIPAGHCLASAGPGRFRLRALGFHPWALTLPQALDGMASVTVG
jgi:hypothetical protein